MKIVLDTNVLVSALINPFGAPARVLDCVLAGGARYVYDDRILLEYREVLTRERFGFPVHVVAGLVEFLKAEGERVSAPPLPTTLPDPDDAPFLEVAVAGGSDTLVTGNLAHFPPDCRQAISVLSPADFLSRYFPSEK